MKEDAGMTRQEFLKGLWGRLAELPQEEVERTLDHYSDEIDSRMSGGFTEEEAVASLGSLEDVAAKVIENSGNKSKDEGSEESGEWAHAKTEPGKGTFSADDEAYKRTDTAAAAADSGSTGSANRSNQSSTSSGSSTSVGDYSSYNAGYSAGFSAGVAGFHAATGYNSKEEKKKSGGKALLLILTFPFWLPLLITACALVFSFYVTIWAIAFSLMVTAGALIVSAVAGIVLLFAMAFSGHVGMGLISLGMSLFASGFGILLMLFAIKVFGFTAKASKGVWRVVKRVFGGKEAVA